MVTNQDRKRLKGKRVKAKRRGRSAPGLFAGSPLPEDAYLAATYQAMQAPPAKGDLLSSQGAGVFSYLAHKVVLGHCRDRA
jgi:hypothetical protein